MTDHKNTPPKKDDGRAKRHWVIVSYKDKLVFGDLVRGYAYQREKCPKTLRDHWQGYIEFSRPVRLQQAKQQIGDLSAHLESRDGTRAQAIAYATKTATRIDGPWVSGSCESVTGQGTRTDLLNAAQTAKTAGLEAVIENHPVEYIKYNRGLEKVADHYLPKPPSWRDLHVTWLWGQTGVGKTKWAYQQDPDLYRLMLPTRGAVIWWDGYKNQKTVLIDDFRGEIPFSTLLHYLDGYPLRMQVKGSTCNAYYTHVIITSNTRPELLYTENVAPLMRRISALISLNNV